jgi:hypothetical protein
MESKIESTSKIQDKYKFHILGTQFNSTKDFIKYLVKRFRRAHIINPYASDSTLFLQYFLKKMNQKLESLHVSLSTLDFLLFVFHTIILFRPLKRIRFDQQKWLFRGKMFDYYTSILTHFPDELKCLLEENKVKYSEKTIEDFVQLVEKELIIRQTQEDEIRPSALILIFLYWFDNPDTAFLKGFTKVEIHQKLEKLTGLKAGTLKKAYAKFQEIFIDKTAKLSSMEWSILQDELKKTDSFFSDKKDKLKLHDFIDKMDLSILKN